MAEPTISTGGIAAIAVAAMSPVAGEYAVIVFAALAGSLWPLSLASTNKAMGALLVLRLVLTAAALTGVAAALVGELWHIPATKLLAPIAFAIAAIGDNWRSLIESTTARFSALIKGGNQ